MNAALRLGFHLACFVHCLLLVYSEESGTCSETVTAKPSAALLQAGANRTGKTADGTQLTELNHEEHEEHEELESLEDSVEDADEDAEHQEHEEVVEAVKDHEESLLKRAHARHAAELELESAIAGKNRRRRSRRRTTTTTTTLDCGSTTDDYSIGWDVTGSTDYCVEGLNTGAATEQIDSSKCTESTRDKWIFQDDGNGYCSLIAKYNDGHRRRNHKGTSVTCGTSSKSVAYCKVNGNQGYKLKLEDLGNNKFSMWWYDSSGTGRKAYRAAGNGGIIIADVSNGDQPSFRVYKNGVYGSTCRMAKSDLGVSCWK